MNPATPLTAISRILQGFAVQATSRSVVLTDSTRPGNPIVFVNAAFAKLTGYSTDDAMGRNCSFLQGPKTNARVVADIRSAVAEGVPIRRELLNYRKSGETFWNDLTIDPIRAGDGRLIGYTGFQHDATAKYQAQTRQAKAERQLTNIADNVPGYVFQRVMKTDGSIGYNYLSASLARILGLPPGTNWSSGASLGFLQAQDRDEFLLATLQSAKYLTPLRCEIRVQSASGAEHWFRTESFPQRLSNGDVVWDGLALDITAEKYYQSKLMYLAEYDELTGLPKRSLLKKYFLNSLRPGEGRSQGLALFQLNLCASRSVNETRGACIADRIMQEAASKLRDFATLHGGMAARLGGDEFGLLLPPPDVRGDTLGTARAIGLAVAGPIYIDGTEETLDACVGVAAYPFEHPDPPRLPELIWDELVKRCSMALATSKLEGAGECHLYSSASDHSGRNRATLRRSLRQAIEGEKFHLQYQPFVDLTSGAIVGGEALVRWQHPELGLQHPDRFIPLAESTRMIVPLGAWVIERVMRQAQSWRRQKLSIPRISINVSSVQLHAASFIDSVKDALESTGADPHDFELELTESVVIRKSAEVSARLASLKALGYSLAIDDFGAGHATFTYLQQIPIDKIKIDQTFIRQLPDSSSDANIVRSMIALSANLNLKVVAEGVETAAQRHFLLQEGCTTGQGYLFSPAVSADDFRQMLENSTPLPAIDSMAVDQSLQHLH